MMVGGEQEQAFNATSSAGNTSYDKPKRPRPVLSCLRCRDKKLKCNREKPCEQCIKTGRPHECFFAIESNGASPETANGQETITVQTRKRARQDTPPHDPEPRGGEGGIGVIEDLQLRVKALEEQLRVSKPSASSNDDHGPSSTTAHQSGSKHLRTLDVDGYRFRFRGQNHRNVIWKQVCLLLPEKPCIADEEQFTDVVPFVQKALSDPRVRVILVEAAEIQKRYAKKYTSSQASPISDLQSALARMVELLPTKFVCDLLIENYFTHWEKTLRVVHVPSFRNEYNDFWEKDHERPSLSPGFIPQLLSILIIATRMHSESQALLEKGFAYKCHTVLKAWQAQLTGKERSYFSNLQAMTLLVIAGQMIPQGLDKMWTETGALVRHAMTLGLHVEPSEYPRVSIFHGEIRRRLWTTILELDIQTAVTSALPTSIRSADYSIRPPSNIDDSDLVEGMERLPIPKHSDEWTDTLPQHALASTTKWRLRAAEIISRNKIEDDRDDTSLVASKLIETLELSSPCLRLSSESVTYTRKPDRLASLLLLDLLSRRALIALYKPIVFSHGWETKMAIRHGFVGSCLRLLDYQEALDPERKDAESFNTKPIWSLLQNIFKQDLFQAGLSVCVELRSMNQLPNDSEVRASSTLWLHTGSSDVDSSLQPSTIKSKAQLVLIVKTALNLLISGIAHHGGDIKECLMLSTVLQSVKTVGPMADKQTAMLEALVNTTNACRQRLQATIEFDNHGNPPNEVVSTTCCLL